MSGKIADKVINIFRMLFTVRNLVESQRLRQCYCCLPFWRKGCRVPWYGMRIFAIYEVKSRVEGPILPVHRGYERGGRAKAWTRQQIIQGNENNELILHYQPRYRPRSGEIRCVEALGKMESAWLRGFISPGMFIPLRSRMGLIGPIGEWVLKQPAVSKSMAWYGLHPIHISVNVSAFRSWCNSKLSLLREYT